MNKILHSKGIQYFNDDYFDFILNYHGIVGSRYSYAGFKDLENLYKLNKMLI